MRTIGLVQLQQSHKNELTGIHAKKFATQNWYIWNKPFFYSNKRKKIVKLPALPLIIWKSITHTFVTANSYNNNNGNVIQCEYFQYHAQGKVILQHYFERKLHVSWLDFQFSIEICVLIEASLFTTKRVDLIFDLAVFFIASSYWKRYRWFSILFHIFF